MLFYLLPRTTIGFGISIVIFVPSCAILASIRRSQKRGVYKVEWTDKRDVSGELEISYVYPDGRLRNGLIVDRIEARPRDPLYTFGSTRYDMVTTAPGTNASMLITFKNRRGRSLLLGFATSEDMYQVYSDLTGEKGKPG